MQHHGDGLALADSTACRTHVLSEHGEFNRFHRSSGVGGTVTRPYRGHDMSNPKRRRGPIRAAARAVNLYLLPAFRAGSCWCAGPSSTRCRTASAPSNAGRVDGLTLVRPTIVVRPLASMCLRLGRRPRLHRRRRSGAPRRTVGGTCRWRHRTRVLSLATAARLHRRLNRSSASRAFRAGRNGGPSSPSGSCTRRLSARLRSSRLGLRPRPSRRW